MGSDHVRRILPSRHRLRTVPQRCERRLALDRHHGAATAARSGLPVPAVRMQRRQRGSVAVFHTLQAVVANICRSADVCVRERLGLVLLDVGDRECDAVELEVGPRRRHPAREGLCAEFQLQRGNTDFLRITRELLMYSWKRLGLVSIMRDESRWHARRFLEAYVWRGMLKFCGDRTSVSLIAFDIWRFAKNIGAATIGDEAKIPLESNRVIKFIIENSSCLEL